MASPDDPCRMMSPKGRLGRCGSQSLWLDIKGQSSEEIQPLKEKKELMLVQLSLIINYNNYTPVFSRLLMASLHLLRA